ncbi:MAG: hypothetical protein RLW68_00940 [Devosia marina]|uniref:hypothetical protein n=1 Tax=Devosia marina TaxID=2683198 RepID=UPI0032EB879E
MTAAISNDLRVFAGQKWPTMNHKWRKNKLASMLRMSERRVKSLYEADPAARVRADEADRIRALINQEEADAALADRIAELEAQVAFLTAAINRDQMASTGAASHQAGNGGTGQSQGIPRRRSTD